jgi:starvation-inducible DNA-binding protein
MAMIQNLMDDHETIIRITTNNIETNSNNWKDQATDNFLTGIMETHEKMRGILRAHLL